MKTSPWPTLLTVLLASQLGGQSLLRCGTPEPTPAQLQASQVALNYFRQANNLSNTRTSFDEVQIPVNFHIVMDNNGNGDVSNSELTDQITVLNDSIQT